MRSQASGPDTRTGGGSIGASPRNEQTPGHDGRVRLPYLAGLDGLRAVAIVAVLLYHAELPWLRGGFLGVEVFFVLSLLLRRRAGIALGILLLAAAALQGALPGVQIDAEVSRQVGVALWVLQSRQAGGQLGDAVVVHIGNNGGFTAEQFDALMQASAGVPRVYVLTVKVPRPWEGPNNAVIVEGVARYPNTRLIDWHAASVDHPEFFWDDGIHLRPEGAVVYAELVRSQFGAP